MLERMPSSGLTRWIAYNRVEPFGQWRSDYRMALLASVFANCHRDPKRRPQPFRPSDFMPEFEPAPPDDGKGLVRVRAALDRLARRSNRK